MSVNRPSNWRRIAGITLATITPIVLATRSTVGADPPDETRIVSTTAQPSPVTSSHLSEFPEECQLYGKSEPNNEIRKLILSFGVFADDDSRPEQADEIFQSRLSLAEAIYSDPTTDSLGRVCLANALSFTINKSSFVAAAVSRSASPLVAAATSGFTPPQLGPR